MLVDRARTTGLQVTGEGGLLQQLTKRVLESALECEITDHVGTGSTTPRDAAAATAVADTPSWRSGFGPRLLSDYPFPYTCLREQVVQVGDPAYASCRGGRGEDQALRRAG